MKVSVICPIKNGAKYLPNLILAIRSQRYVDFIEIILPISPSDDDSFKLASSLGDVVYKIENFSHSLTRQEASLKASGEFLVFITQDIMPKNDTWLFELIKDLKGDIIASFSRQIAYRDHPLIEKYLKEFNYPKNSKIITYKENVKNSRDKLFFSDASSAFIAKDFFELNGFDFKVNFCEDVFMAYKILMGNKSFKYSADSEIFHSHNYSFKQLFLRYKSIGKFEKENSFIFKNFTKTEKKGINSFVFILKKLILLKEYVTILKLPLDFFIRFIGYKFGKWS